VTVTPTLYVEDVEERAWNPWRDLRGRPHLRLVWARLNGCRGLIEDDGNERRIVLDSRLDRRARSAVLGHELVHDERDVLYRADSPAGLVQREEECVNREVARRLVPRTLLAQLVGRLEELGEPVHAVTVCEEFDVELGVAQRALWLLEQERRSR
jgi:hypothetical protein